LTYISTLPFIDSAGLFIIVLSPVREDWIDSPQLSQLYETRSTMKKKSTKRFRTMNMKKRKLKMNSTRNNMKKKQRVTRSKSQETKNMARRKPTKI
jgi:pyruvate/2-oxoacid:ferredoxin oxidoreductase beta subunit